MLNQPTNLELAQQAQLEKLQAEVDLMRLIGTREGFYQYYFKQINKYKSREEAFEAINEMYFTLFQEYRYTNYNSFRRAINHHTKNR